MHGWWQHLGFQELPHGNKSTSTPPNASLLFRRLLTSTSQLHLRFASKYIFVSCVCGAFQRLLKIERFYLEFPGHHLIGIQPTARFQQSFHHKLKDVVRSSISDISSSSFSFGLTDAILLCFCSFRLRLSRDAR